MILAITEFTFQSFSCFSHMIYAWQTTMYKNAAKLLTHPSILWILFQNNNDDNTIKKFKSIYLDDTFDKLQGRTCKW